MELFLKYIRQKWRIGLPGMVCCLIFFVSFVLYHLPIKAIIYPASISVLVCTIWLIFDFRRVKHRHTMMMHIRNFVEAVSGTFPRIEGIEDEDYQNVIQLLSKEHYDYCTKNSRQYAEMIDYYTVWAHQIKTPIAAMRLHLQNEDTSLSRKLSLDLFRIEQYVEMVLTFLRLDGEGNDYVIREYDLDAIVKQAVKKFAGEFIDRKLSLIYEPFHIKVVTDEKWLAFVIEQVLSNALKYTVSGSIEISLEPEKKLCIRDTGIGIAPEDLPRIFEQGYTGYNGRTDKKASGIGLYLCKRICTNLGHGIKAESVVDEGTVITIDLTQRKCKVE